MGDGHQQYLGSMQKRLAFLYVSRFSECCQFCFEMTKFEYCFCYYHGRLTVHLQWNYFSSLVNSYSIPLSPTPHNSSMVIFPTQITLRFKFWYYYSTPSFSSRPKPLLWIVSSRYRIVLEFYACCHRFNACDPSHPCRDWTRRSCFCPLGSRF